MNYRPKKRKLFREILLEQDILTEDVLAEAEKKSRATHKSLKKIILEEGHCTEEDVSELLSKCWKDIVIGDLLVQLELVKQEDLEKVLNKQNTSERLGELLVKEKLINESDFLDVLGKQLGILQMYPLIELVDMHLLNKFTEDFLRKNCVLPLFQIDSCVSCITSDPFNTEIDETLKSICACKEIHLALASKDAIISSLNRIFSDSIKGGAHHHKITPLHVSETPSSDLEATQPLMDYFIRDALKINASDIYMETTQGKFNITYRVDGILHHKTDLPTYLAPILISHIKAICGLNITEKRLPQDGKLVFKVMGHEVDLRIATYPSEFGEALTIRILDRQKIMVDLCKLGFNKGHLDTYFKTIHYPSGLTLVTGPTGSGKTTTLYSSINYLKSKNKRIITIEDPIEYTVPGIIQANYRPDIGVNYETILKAMMRQSPDVILLGEIRDRSAAEATIHAALTGHKVFSTFHTEDTIGALLRLMDMGIETFLISSTVVCVIAQRLVRMVCKQCIEEYIPEEHTLNAFRIKDLDIKNNKFFKGKGCSHCLNTGYKGRVGIFEVLILNDDIRDAILQRKTSGEIREIVFRRNDMLSMLEDGFYKSLKGITSPDEVLRVCYNIRSDPVHNRTAEEIMNLCEGNGKA